MPQAPPTAGRFDHLRGALREFPALLWSFLYFFFLLTGYYVLRPVRDAMGAANDPSAVFPVAMVDWFAARGVALGDYQVQALFTGTFIAMVVTVIGALRSFDLVSIMTAGGPYGSSSVLSYFMYEQALSEYGFRMGYGASIAVVLFLIMMVFISLFIVRMLAQERNA